MEHLPGLGGLTIYLAIAGQSGRTLVIRESHSRTALYLRRTSRGPEILGHCHPAMSGYLRLIAR